MRLALTTATLNIGGVRRHLQHLCDSFKDEFSPVAISIFEHPTEPAEPLADAETVLLNIPAADRFKKEIIIDRLEQVLKKNKVEILHSHHYFSDIYSLPAAKACGIGRSIRTVHGILQVSPSSLKKEVVRYDWSQEEIENELAIEAACTATICVSRELKSKLVSYGFPYRKLRTVHNGVDTEKFKRQESTVKASTAFSLPEKSKQFYVIGFIGRLEQQKNILLLPPICESLRTRVDDVLFLVVGSGTQKDKLLNEIARRGLHENFIVRPFVSDIEKILSTLDILLLPSLTEGCPYTLLEAMAMEIPVIASPVGAVADILENWKNGVVLNQLLPHVAAAEIEKLIRSKKLRASLGREARRTVLDRFRLSNQISEIEEIYKRCKRWR